MLPKHSGITQQIWLFLLEHGGHWTVSELAEQLGGSHEYMDRILWSMHKGGRISKYRSGQRKNGSAFGVSQKNRIPQWITLQQVASAMAVRAAIEAPAHAANDSRARERA